MADLLQPVRATGLLPPGEPVIALLSGGRDSVCLLDCALRLSGREAVLALHVNYGLRPEADATRSTAACCVSASGSRSRSSGPPGRPRAAFPDTAP
ncbi:MAG: hypothetical protein M3515_10060 [Actinomycetota bacterium]|nr:hypothetical protein [Actinomycetota bacterium]